MDPSGEFEQLEGEAQAPESTRAVEPELTECPQLDISEAVETEKREEEKAGLGRRISNIFGRWAVPRLRTGVSGEFERVLSPEPESSWTRSTLVLASIAEDPTSVRPQVRALLEQAEEWRRGQRQESETQTGRIFGLGEATVSMEFEVAKQLSLEEAMWEWIEAEPTVGLLPELEVRETWAVETEMMAELTLMLVGDLQRITVEGGTQRQAKETQVDRTPELADVVIQAVQFPERTTMWVACWSEWNLGLGNQKPVRYRKREWRKGQVAPKGDQVVIERKERRAIEESGAAEIPEDERSERERAVADMEAQAEQIRQEMEELRGYRAKLEEECEKLRYEGRDLIAVRRGREYARPRYVQLGRVEIFEVLEPKKGWLGIF
jgi:hypothetical protein